MTKAETALIRIVRLLSLAIGIAVVAFPSQAETAHNKQAANSSSKKEMRFEVVSIRPLKPGTNGMTMHLTQDGYVARMAIWDLLLAAYAPGGTESWGTTYILGGPKWLTDEYEINARVPNDDVVAWKNQGINENLLHSALKAVLKDRFKLIAHEQPRDIPSYNLIIAKNGPKLKATPPGAVTPSGFQLQEGGVVNGNRYSGVTMAGLAQYLTQYYSLERPVHDMTGLTGHYDFTLQTVDPDNRKIDNFVFRALGLELKPSKTAGFSIVIDHIEKPTPN